jgi:hypothetical protein
MNQWKNVMKSVEDFQYLLLRFSWQVSYYEYGGDGGGKYGRQDGFPNRQ